MLAAIMVTPAAADGRYPDWQSQWRNPTAGRGGNPWDTTKPMGLVQQAMNFSEPMEIVSPRWW